MITLDNINNIKGDYRTKLSQLLGYSIKNNYRVWSFKSDYRWDNSTIQLVIIFPSGNTQNTIDIVFTRYDISNNLLSLGISDTNKLQQSFIADLIEIIKPIVSQFLYELADASTYSKISNKVYDELNNYLKNVVPSLKYS